MRKLTLETAKEYLEKIKSPYKWVYIDENGNEIDSHEEIYPDFELTEELLTKFIKDNEKNIINIVCIS